MDFDARHPGPEGFTPPGAEAQTYVVAYEAEPRSTLGKVADMAMDTLQTGINYAALAHQGR